MPLTSCRRVYGHLGEFVSSIRDPNQGTGTDNLTAVECQEYLAARGDYVFIRIIQGVMIGFFELPVRLDPLDVEALEGALESGFVLDDLHEFYDSSSMSRSRKNVMPEA